MGSFLIYVIQVNVLLTIVFWGYHLLLKNLTFYKLNRFYFFTGIVFSLTYPFLDLSSLFSNGVSPAARVDVYLPFLNDQTKNASNYTFATLMQLVIFMGVFIFSCRFVLQILSLLRVHYYSLDATWEKYFFRNVLFPVAPFSFFNRIYLHIEQHKGLELQNIFEHENIHVKGLHSMDILCFEMLLVGCWYNPFVWLMRSAVRQNLEFLTDQQVLNKGVDRQTYQYSLLRVTREGTSVTLSNQFNFKVLKTRIMMMNKKRSSKLQLTKYAFLLPVIIFSAGAFTVNRAEAQIEQVVFKASELPLGKGREVFVALSDTVVEPTVVQENKRKPASQKVVEPRIEMVEVGKTEDTKTKQKHDQDLKPVYLVNGKQIDKDSLSTIDPNDIHTVNVWKGDKAKERFGDKVSGGVVEVVLKDTIDTKAREAQHKK